MVRVGFVQVIQDLFFCSDIDFGDEVRSGFGALANSIHIIRCTHNQVTRFAGCS